MLSLCNFLIEKDIFWQLFSVNVQKKKNLLIFLINKKRRKQILLFIAKLLAKIYSFYEIKYAHGLEKAIILT